MKMRTSLQQFALFLTFSVTVHSQTMTSKDFARINYCGDPSGPVSEAANANVLEICRRLNKKNKNIGGTCMNTSVTLQNEQLMTGPVIVRIGVCYTSNEYLYCVTDHPEKSSDVLAWPYRNGTCEPRDRIKSKGSSGKFIKSDGKGNDKSGDGSGSMADGLPTAYSSSVAYGEPVDYNKYSY